MARAESDVRIGQQDKGGVMDWVKARFPLDSMLKEHVTEYYASKNFNIWYVFGVLSMVV
ncbi:MAG: cytochrome b, partial [Pseudomonadota bacterium]